jgi:hypothetical protein
MISEEFLDKWINQFYYNTRCNPYDATDAQIAKCEVYKELVSFLEELKEELKR